MPKTTYFANAILNYVLRGVDPGLGSSLYVSLFTGAPNVGGGGTEVTGGSYSRRAVTRNTSNFAAPSSGASSNTGLVDFGFASANWGTITHVGIHDASTGGNLLFFAPLTTSRIINQDDGFSCPIGDLDWQEA